MSPPTKPPTGTIQAYHARRQRLRQNRRRHGGGNASHGAHRNGGGGGGNGGGDGHRSGGRGSHIPSSLLDPSNVREGGDLRRLANAMARIETLPQMRAYSRLANEIRGQAHVDSLGLQRLGRNTAQSLGGVYQGFDAGAQAGTQRAAAVGQMLTNQVEGQQAQATADQQAVQTGQLGGLTEALALRGAPGGGQAQQQLAALVEQQAARRAAEGQAQGASAAAQGAAYTGLAEGARSAANLQGVEAQRDIRSTIASRVAQTKLEAGQDIREALGKRADARALRGSIMLKHLSELTESERDFILGQAAVKNDSKSIRADARNDRADNALTAAQQAETARHNRATERTSRHNASHNGSGSSGGSGSGGNENQQERKKDKKQAYSAAQTIGQGESAETIKRTFSAFVDEIHDRTGVPYNIARAMAKKYLKRKSQR